MIRYVTGTLGAGKTFHSVRLGIDHLRRGGTVVTNVECCPDVIFRRIACKWGVLCRPDQLRVFDPEKTPAWESEIPWGEAEGVVLVILDEAQLFYGSRDWATTAAQSKRLLSFLTQSRKAGVDVIWITQDAGNVDKQFRVLAEWELNIVNIRHLPLGWLGLVPLNMYCVKHISARVQIVVKKEWFPYAAYVKGAYRTDALLNEQMRELGRNAERLGLYCLERVGWWARLKILVSDELANLKKKIRLCA